MIVVGLGGAKRAGKDTVADFLAEHHGFKKVAFADPLKWLLGYMNPMLDNHTSLRVNSGLASFGEEYLKDNFPEYRELLVRLGMGVREMYADFWVDTLIDHMKDSFGQLGPDHRWVVTDVRFDNEADGLREIARLVPTSVVEIWKVHNRRAEAAARADVDPTEFLFDRPNGWARTIDNNGAIDFTLSQVESAAFHIIGKE